MEKFIILFVLFIVIIMLLMQYDSNMADVTYVISHFDNKQYLVRNENDKSEAANLLAETRRRLIILTDHLKDNFGDKVVTKQIDKLFNPDAITEAAETSKYTSYSINKGEKVVLCLRSRDGENKLIDINTLVFVALHELAHIGTISVGHTTEFWDNFKFVLKESVKLSIYEYQDFNNNPKQYCGIKITDQPLNQT
jgi:predicted metal-dependent hydrolase